MLQLLVIKPSSLGDIIHGLQVVQSLRDQMPPQSIRVSWVVREIFAPFVQACDTVDEVFVFRRHGGLRGFWALLQELRMHSFDWIWDMQGLARSGLLTFFCKGTHKAGRFDAREGSRLAYSHRIPLAVGPHAVDILLQFLPLLECAPILKTRELLFSKRGESVFASSKWQKSILLFPNSRRAEKEWHGFVPLTQLLVQEGWRHPIVWVGQNSLSKEGVEGAHFFDLLGKTSLIDVIALMEKAELVVCCDSGPMHLAAAMGKKIVALFGPTDPQRFGPYPLEDPNHRVIWTSDLRELSPELVMEAIREMKSRY